MDAELSEVAECHNNGEIDDNTKDNKPIKGDVQTKKTGVGEDEAIVPRHEAQLLMTIVRVTVSKYRHSQQEEMITPPPETP